MLLMCYSDELRFTHTIVTSQPQSTTAHKAGTPTTGVHDSRPGPRVQQQKGANAAATAQ